MAVDKGYGSGYKNSGKAKPAAPRARRARGSAKPNTPLSQMSRAEYNARIVQGQGARRRSNGNFSANALENLTGFNSRDGVDAGDIAGLALAIPAGIAGAVLRAGSRLVPAGVRIAKAATRVSRAASRSRHDLQEPLAKARKATDREVDHVGYARREAYTEYGKAERYFGSSEAEALYGSERYYVNKATDNAIKSVASAKSKESRLERLAERAADRSDILGSTAEIKRRLSALKRAKKNR